MPYRSHSFSIENALATSQATYDVDFVDWGFRRDPLNPNENVRFPSPGQPAISTTLAGIMIGPKSTVDRCWVSWDNEKNLTNVDQSDLGLVTSELRRLSVDSPLMYAQATKKGTLTGTIFNSNNAMQKGLLYVFAYADGSDELAVPPINFGYLGNTTVLPFVYINQFGGLKSLTAGTSELEAPFLHLVLALRPPTFTAPTKRFPMLRTKQAAVSAVGTKNLIFLLPIFGRKHVRVQVVSRTSGPVLARVCDFYLGLLRNVNESSVAYSDDKTPVFEVNAGTTLALPVDTPFQFTIDNPGADYLVMYATAFGGLGNIFYTVVAED